MPNNFKRSTEAINADAAAVTALANNGYLRIYDGAQPSDPDVALTTQNLLAELRLNATAYQAPVNGVAAANALTKDSAADRTGTAAWFRVFKSDGTSPVFDGTVGTTGCDLNLATTSIVQNVEVNVTALSYTAVK